jgi:FKBP-type peptidyl-prolyl cis-trans isomerase (trigger factor)
MLSTSIFGCATEDVEARLKREQESQAELVIKEDAAAENGDTVVIDFEGFLGDEAFEGGKGENYSLASGKVTFTSTSSPAFLPTNWSSKPGINELEPNSNE